MADLITHAAIGVMVKVALGRKHLAIFVAGNLLPDVLSRLPSMAANALRDPLALPPGVVYAWEPLHMPVGMVLSAYLIAMMFHADQRRAIFANLLGGMALHLGVDVLQSHLGAGYALLYPISDQGFELGWIGSEATIPWAVPLAILAGLIWRYAPSPSAACR